MSMTDGLDVNDFDRRQGSLDPKREAADTSSKAKSDGQAMGPVVQISPKLVGCGCFGCSSVVFLAGCVALLGIVWGFLLPIWNVNNRYIPNTGLVLDKRLDSQMFQVADPDGRGGRRKPSRIVRRSRSGMRSTAENSRFGPMTLPEFTPPTGPPSRPSSTASRLDRPTLVGMTRTVPTRPSWCTATPWPISS